jgi:hypothetical protein
MRGYGDDSNILLGQRVQSSELEPCSDSNIHATISFPSSIFIISFIIVLLYCFVLFNMISGLHHYSIY